MDRDTLVDALDDLATQMVAVTAVALARGGPERDLTLSQWRALVLIASTDGVRASDVAPRVGMSRPSMSRLVRRLERKGLVVAEPDPTDGRAVIWSSSAIGRRALVDTRSRRRGAIRAALDKIGGRLPNEPEGAIRMIATILAA